MSDERQKLFLEGPIGTALLRLAVPIVLGNLLQTGYQLTDAFWVGRLGGTAVAAVAVSFPVTFLAIALGAGLAIAGATLSAQYMGAGRQDMVNHVAAQTMLMVAITSAVMGAAGYVLAPYLLELIGVAPDVYHGALGFMRVSFIGIIFVFLYGMFQALMRGVGETKVPLIIVLGTVILNFILDPLFIFGFGWLPAQGVMGAALATLATQGLAAVLGIAIFLRGHHGIQLNWRDFRPDPQYIRRAFFLGLPGSVELSTRGLGPMLMTFLVTGFGTVNLAAYGIGSNILQFITIPAMGLSMAVSTLVSQNIGAGNVQRAAHVTLLGTVWGFAILTAAGLIAYVFAPVHGRLLRCRRFRGYCRGLTFHPRDVPGLGRHGRAALHRLGVSRLRQPAGRHGDRDRFAVHVPVSARLRLVKAHRTSGRRHMVVLSHRECCRGIGVGVLVRPRRLEKNQADRRRQASGAGGRGNRR